MFRRTTWHSSSASLVAPAVIGGLFELGKALIGRIFPDPEQKARAELELLQMEQAGKLEELKTNLSAILAEASSPDPWTSRARPSFMYVIYMYILAAIPMGILFAHDPGIAVDVTEGVKKWLEAIPTELYALFGAGYLGYGYFRNKEKIAGVSK